MECKLCGLNIDMTFKSYRDMDIPICIFCHSRDLVGKNPNWLELENKMNDIKNKILLLELELDITKRDFIKIATEDIENFVKDSQLNLG